MEFIWPTMLLLLLLAPLGVYVYLRLQRRQASLAARYRGLGLSPHRSTGQAGRRAHIPPLLFLLGLTGLLVAIARPQAVVEIPRLEGIVMLGFDVSGSMAAEDLQPTRMEAAKAAAQEFVRRQPATIKIGVVAFSDNGLAVQPPTADQEAILAAIQRLAPQRGTSLAQGILISLRAIASASGQALPEQSDEPAQPALPDGPFENAVIVLLSDGENNAPPDPFEAAQAAAERNVRIHTIGIGSPAGIDLNINGFTVHTQLDEGALQQIAQLTGGQYYNAAGEGDLRQIYQNLAPQLVVKPEKMEVTALLAGAGILALLIGSVFSLLWFGRIP